MFEFLATKPIYTTKFNDKNYLSPYPSNINDIFDCGNQFVNVRYV